MRLKEIETRLAELRDELEQDDANLEEINVEIDNLIEERANLVQQEEKQQRTKEINTVLNESKLVRSFVPEAEKVYDESSPEYRNAFYKQLAKKEDAMGNVVPLFGEMTDEEKRAFTFTTQNTPILLPTSTKNMILELVESSNAILADLDINRFLAPYKVPRHIEIVAGDAQQMAEDAVPEGEEDKFDAVELIGVDFKKGIEVTANMKMQSISAFENWIVKHIIARLNHAANQYVYEQIDKGLADENKITTEAGVTANDLLTALSKVRGGNVKIYTGRKVIFTDLATIKDGQDRQIFYHEASNPLERGVIHGAVVKEDSSLPENVMYIGAPETIEANMFEEPNVVAMPQKGRMTWYDGFMKFDAALLDPKGFVKVTITPSV